MGFTALCAYTIYVDSIDNVYFLFRNLFFSNVKQVLILGTFLKNQREVEKYRWSCMFGEVEVPAEILAYGILCCRAPPHRDGPVPFYVTCSNRLACSEVREFDYKLGSTKDFEITDIYNGNTNELSLHLRLEKLLYLGSVKPSGFTFGSVTEKQNLIYKIISLKEEDESYQQVDRANEKDFSEYEVKENLLTKLMKEKLYSWLLHKVTEDGKGPNILDNEGQGVLHLAAALGYNWAIKPIITAGVSINFRDINGWTALHWAAFYGRQGPLNLSCLWKCIFFAGAPLYVYICIYVSAFRGFIHIIVVTQTKILLSFLFKFMPLLFSSLPGDKFYHTGSKLPKVNSMFKGFLSSQFL